MDALTWGLGLPLPTGTGISAESPASVPRSVLAPKVLFLDWRGELGGGGGPGTSAEEHEASENPTFCLSLKDPEKLSGLQSVSFETFKGRTPNTDLFGLEGAETFLSSVTSVIYYVWEVPLCLLAPNLGGFFFFCKLTGF